MIKQAIAKLVEKENLKQDLVSLVMEEIMSGQASQAQIAAFLLTLRLKGETVEEITAAAKVMRKHVTKINSKQKLLLDTCGTGGDASGSFNISTISALVVAGAGVAVAKHGNRSVSSKCGSADLLMHLGVNIDIQPKKIEQCLNTVGFGFLYAPKLHQAMKFATPVRREIGLRTIFNILGPITNPADANCQLLGVYDQKLTKSLAQVLKNLGSKHVLVVHGADGLDEVTTTGPTVISELKTSQIKTYTIKPGDFGLRRVSTKDLKGGTPSLNARIARNILKGNPGAQRDAVLINAGCAIYAVDMAGSIKQGIAKAAQSIDSGKALEKLSQLREFTNK